MSSVPSKKIVYVLNSMDFFISHRLPIAKAAIDAGYGVHLITDYGNNLSKIKALAPEITFHHIRISRSGQNPFSALLLIFALYRLFNLIKPDIAHLITSKPIIFGSLAARLSKVKSITSAVSGLGSVFTATGTEAYLRSKVVLLLYRLAFRSGKHKVIFQNADDQAELLHGDELPSHGYTYIRGSGVNLEEFRYLPEPSGTTVVVMAARLLKDKGVREYVDAARILHSREIDIEMRLIGDPDFGNPSSVSEEQLTAWRDEGIVSLLGYRTDISVQYAKANIVCLPSYREGLPKGLAEAGACGRAIVTTDVPGCRDAIEPNVSGLLVEAKNSLALADAIEFLAKNDEIRTRMGEASRRLAENAFDLNKIIQQHMDIYQELLEND